MSTMASQITTLTIVSSTVYSGAYQRKHQSSASLAFVRGIHRSLVNSPHKRPVTRNMFPFGDVIMLNFPLFQIPNADRRVPDSAATATAMLCGQKTNFYTVGVTDKVKLADCSNIESNRLKSALKHAVDKGNSWQRFPHYCPLVRDSLKELPVVRSFDTFFVVSR